MLLLLDPERRTHPAWELQSPSLGTSIIRNLPVNWVTAAIPVSKLGKARSAYVTVSAVPFAGSPEKRDGQLKVVQGRSRQTDSDGITQRVTGKEESP